MEPKYQNKQTNKTKTLNEGRSNGRRTFQAVSKNGSGDRSRPGDKDEKMQSFEGIWRDAPKVQVAVW